MADTLTQEQIDAMLSSVLSGGDTASLDTHEEKEEIPAEKEVNPVKEETPMEEDLPFLAEVLDTVLSSREIAFLRRNAVPAVIVLILLFFVTAIALRNQNATSSSDDAQKKEPSPLEQNPEEDSMRDANLGVLDNTHAAQKDEVQ